MNSGRHSGRNRRGNQRMEVNFLCEKYNVGRNIVMDAYEFCGDNPDLIDQYLSERTGRGRGSSLDPGQNGPK